MQPVQPLERVREYRGDYYCVRDSRDRILADLMPERQARRFIDRWNARDIGRWNPARLIPLLVTVREVCR